MHSITTKELPAWFKLSRYEKLDRLDVKDWLPNLFLRARYLNRNVVLEEYRKDIECMLRENTWLPLIVSFNDKDIPKFMKFMNRNVTAPAKPLETATVHSMQVGDIVVLSNMISAGKDELSRQMAEAAEYLKRDNEGKRKEINEDLENFLARPFELLMKSPVKDYGTAKIRERLHVEVDLAAPDKVIIDDFSSWLSAARSEFDLPAQKFFTEAKQDDLIAYRVLPYLDLTLWAALEQVTIEHAVMAEALFPHAGVDTAYRVRKVTKVKADWAIQWTVLRALYKQIASEG